MQLPPFRATHDKPKLWVPNLLFLLLPYVLYSYNTDGTLEQTEFLQSVLPFFYYIQEYIFLFLTLLLFTSYHPLFALLCIAAHVL